MLSSDESNGAPRWRLTDSTSVAASPSIEIPRSAPVVRTATVSLQQDISHRAQLVVSREHTVSSQVEPQAPNQQQIASDILEYLSKATSACTTLELSKIAKVRRGDMEPVLNQLMRDDLMEQTQKMPPSWKITPSGLAATTADVDERDSVHNNLDDDLYMEEDSSCNSLNIDLSHIPEDNIEDRLIAILQSDPVTERTDLEFAKLAGSSYTRGQVTPVLEGLAGRGLVTKLPGFPTKWRGMEALKQEVERMDHSESHLQQVYIQCTCNWVSHVCRENFFVKKFV